MTKESQSTGGRGERVSELLTGVRSYLFDQLNRSQQNSEERGVAYDLMIQAGQVEKALRGVDNDTVRQVERDRVRPLIWEVRRFSLRNHLMLIHPLWRWATVQVDPNALCVVGGTRVESMMTRVARERDLRVLKKPTGWGAAQIRWNQMRECAVAVFALESDETRASACHDLGFALALGVYPIVTLPVGAELPFDIDLPPVELTNAPEDEVRLGDAVDEALFGLHPTAGEVSSVQETIRAVSGVATGSDATTRVLSRRLDEIDHPDPIQVNDLLGQILAVQGDGKSAVVRCTWPGSYPDPGKRRCFHVMPFSEPWSDVARDTVRASCEMEGVRYRRGDETEEQRIIRAIWQEICRATHVIVDITGLNANVCLELGLAQAVGRHTLLLAREDGTIKKLYPEIAKLQVRTYSDATLTDIIREFLQTSGGGD